MNKIIVSILLLLFPAIGLYADTALSFAPPPGDYSVIFLGNVFGVVDGVISGNGSQIMGAMFGVFNAAVLALGGIIIMYTLLVSTVNTAHEGQMLGQKWSSLWVPTRATLGLALLIPKASGYCIMQIFVMWVVIQGVGAADKVWDAALSYLNRGGVIVQAQIDPIAMLKGPNSNLYKGATAILSGQTCMLGLERVLAAQLKAYQNSAAHKSGPCAGNPQGTMATFCKSSVPDFLASVNAVNFQSANPDQTTPYVLPMPNFNSGSDYAVLNGICGTIQWAPLSTEFMSKISGNVKQLTPAEIQTTKMSRAIAIQQMYQDLSEIAEVAVNNDPQIPARDGPSNQVEDNLFSPIAKDQYGVPTFTSGVPCRNLDPNCSGWGEDPSGKSAPLFAGTEFQNAISDYNGIMAATLNLNEQATDADTANKQRKFISDASRQGWIMAGAYFFDLAVLNNNTSAASINRDPLKTKTTNNRLIDTESGLEASEFNVGKPTSSFQEGGCAGTLCVWLQGNSKPIDQVLGLINGGNVLPSPVPTPTFDTMAYTAVLGQGSSTIYGFANNSVMVQIPTQPGLQPPKFAINFKIQKFNQLNDLYNLPKLKFGCDKLQVMLFWMCLGRVIATVIYNQIIVRLWSWVMAFFLHIIDWVLMAFISLPLYALTDIFTVGMRAIQQPSINPIIALSTMGANYINFAHDLWLFLTEIAIIGILAPIVGLFVLPMLAMTLPLLFAWVGTMVGIGFVTAYYVPFLPYMIFTFGAIAWLMVVIEAMVAAPIVALGVTHPEGEGAFGKGEQAIMILMNVFLRPAMMIIGYIAGIVLSYVSVWIINAGYMHVASYITGGMDGRVVKVTSHFDPKTSDFSLTKGYTSWAGMYGFFFSILIYTSMYITVVSKAFTLITVLPDKVLRWISGGQQEQVGQEASSWGDEAKGQIRDAGKSTTTASGQMEKQATGYASMGAQAIKSPAGGVEDTGG